RDDAPGRVPGGDGRGAPRDDRFGLPGRCSDPPPAARHPGILLRAGGRLRRLAFASTWTAPDPALDGSVHLAPGLAFLDHLALVVLPAPLREPELHLRDTVLDVQA